MSTAEELDWEKPAWFAYAACKGLDPDLFFSGRGDHLGIAAAKEVCRRCPVREECLEYAMANSEKFGVWGGMSERERRRERRARRERLKVAS